MKRTDDFQKHSVTMEVRPDGTQLMSSTEPLSAVVNSTGDWLHQWSTQTPDQVFLAERSGAGWREESYASVLAQVKALASSLVARGLNESTPIVILSGNSVDHGLLSLAAQYVGIPTVPVAEQYSLIPEAHSRLKHVIDLTKPSLIYASDAKQYAQALALNEVSDLEIVSSLNCPSSVTSFNELLKGDSSVHVENAHSQVGPDTVAKILMTSGSTSAPKGVLTTHKMMCANQAQIADALPFLRKRRPRLTDWLPWNHVFGGSHNFNLVLANGGSLYIDDGKPAKGLFNRTVENLGLVPGSICFNVPVGFQMLFDALTADKSFRVKFFKELDMIFYAGASLPQEVWEGFENMALDVKGEVPLMTSSWGLTETAPATLMQQEPTDRSGVVGIPLNNVVAKLIPEDDDRFEIRVKGPNIMPGYFKAVDQTSRVFDDEGFFITGDAMRFVDEGDPNKGLQFVGRLSEDFKLLSGTWVRAAQLRLDLLGALSPIAADLVVTGADKNEIGLLIFPNLQEISSLGFSINASEGVLTDVKLVETLRQRLETFSTTNAGSSRKVVRALLMSEPASIADSEITAKGSLNFRKVLTLRADLLERLYKDDDPAIARID